MATLLSCLLNFRYREIALLRYRPHVYKNCIHGREDVYT